MAWETKWQVPVAPEWAKPNDGGFTEKLKQSIKAEVRCDPEELTGINNVALGVKPDTRTDAQKIFDDQIMYGRSFSKDGKHIPIEDVLIHKPELETQLLKLGNKTIQVIIVGDLGLDFCEPGEKDEGWNIYHLPTLACFSSAVPSSYIHPNDFIYDKQPLLNWMARVQENYPTSWQVLRLLTPDTYKDNGETAKEIIQKWCLSVKVE